MILNFMKIKNHREKKDPRTNLKKTDNKSNYNLHVFKFSFESKTGSQKQHVHVSYRDTFRGDTGVQNSQFPFWLIFSLIPICFTFVFPIPQKIPDRSFVGFVTDFLFPLSQFSNILAPFSNKHCHPTHYILSNHK